MALEYYSHLEYQPAQKAKLELLYLFLESHYYPCSYFTISLLITQPLILKML